ncbi:MAG: hypothetical protein LH654_15705 [Thermoleophilia bacterium]|nr:hypothetical protein [Thermoleophilia bacterium]
MNGSELDFWLGSWHARWEGGEGTNTITREFDDRVVVERFEGRPSMELTGYSVSVFDAEADLWRQTWVDDWERSKDAGATWEPAWEIAYTRTG